MFCDLFVKIEGASERAVAVAVCYWYRRRAKDTEKRNASDEEVTPICLTFEANIFKWFCFVFLQSVNCNGLLFLAQGSVGVCVYLLTFGANITRKQKIK